MARYGYDDGWTVVTRRRRRINYGPDRSAQQPNHYTNRRVQNRETFSYADAVKYGRQAKPITIPYAQFIPHPYRPQQASFRPRANPPYDSRSREPRVTAYVRRPRNPTPNRPRVTFTRPHNKEAQQNETANQQRSEDPLFVPKTRALLKLIKLVHHKNNVAQGLPPAIQKLEQHLAEVIKPALPNADTQALIGGNAKNWAYTTLLILKDHYEDSLKTELACLQNLPAQGWEDCFITATQWAKRGIGRRLQDKTIHEAFSLAQEHWGALAPGAKTTPHAHEQPDTQTTATISVEGERVCVQAEVHVDADPQSQPQETRLFKTAATMTEPAIDWSPSRELDFSEVTVTPLNAQTSLPNTTPTPQDPQREKRTPRLRPIEAQPNPCVIQDLADQIEVENMPPEGTPVQRQEVTDSPLAANLATATQTRLIPDLGASTPIGVHLDTQGGRPTRHMSTNRKMVDWRLSVRKKWLLLGDSNLSRMPYFDHMDLQVDSYPGATFRHMEAVIKKAAVSMNVEHVVLSLGINSRTQNPKDTTVKQMQAALRAAKQTFPAAQIWVPIVNFSGILPLKEQSNLNILNAHIQNNMQHIPALPKSEFHTESDNIHWTRATAESMLQHWLVHLK